MYGPNEIKTAFITLFGCFFYITIPFSLKNVGSNFESMIPKCLQEQISRNVEVYMDDIAVKYRKRSDLLADLTETFVNLRRFGIKINQAQYTFSVPARKLLGFHVSEWGIDANPDKIGAIVQMRWWKRIHDVKRLMGFLATLSRIISRLHEKALPL